MSDIDQTEGARAVIFESAIKTTSRSLDEADWINQHASGTLRHSKNLGLFYHSLYLHERVAFTFGLNFNIVPRSRLTYGPAIAEGDNHAFTEACFCIRRVRSENAFDLFSNPVYITVENDTTEEGLGVLVRSAGGCEWIPKSHIIYAILAPCKKENGKSVYVGTVNYI